MSYKVGKTRTEITFLPACLDDYVPENHICRVIHAFVTMLDIAALGFKNATIKSLGNRPYDPRTMLMLYIYGYLNRIRSSRRLEAEAKRNVEVMWLMGNLTPDDKTICNFRTDNTKALKAVFKEFVKMCRGLELYGGETAATDGTKFRANNSRKNNHNTITVERELSRIDKQISEYMNALDAADAAEAHEKALDPVKLKETLVQLQKRKEKFEGYKESLKTKSEISTVDSDARLMKSGGDARALDVCYNVQTVTDDKYGLIVDFEVTNQSNDKGQLHNMSIKAKEALNVDKLINLADKGFYDGEDISACEQDGITCLVAKPKAGGDKKEEGFTHEDFKYDRENNCYVCPCLQRLKFMRLHKHNNGKYYNLYANYSACGKCPQKSKCTKTKNREILRSMYQDTLDIVDERTRNNKALYRKRQEIVEHPFGTVKAVWGYKQFLCRTEPKVTAETALAYLAYNFRRVINIFAEKNLDLTAAIRLFFSYLFFYSAINGFFAQSFIKFNFSALF